MASDSERFAKVAKDPKFRIIPKKEAKLEVDDRFKRMFTDKKFNDRYVVDKYGRKVKREKIGEDLRRFYKLKKDGKKTSNTKDQVKKPVKVQNQEDEEEEDDENGQLEEEDDEEQPQKDQDQDDEEAKAEDEDEDEDEDDDAEEKEYDPARGIGVTSSEDDDDEFDEEVEDGDEDEDEDNEEDNFNNDDEEEAIFDSLAEEKAKVPLGDASKRFAVIDMDWDKIRAVDLLKLFESFAPRGSNGVVSIYPSEFGKERIAQEERSGPPLEIFKKEEADVDKEEAKRKTKERKKLLQKGKLLLDDDTSEEFDPQALRKYQLERLKYYFAVVEFDSVEAADHVYEQCNNMEFENSSNVLDLRFIPDDMTFDDPPREVAREVPPNYKPIEFETKALQHSKVELTWDDDKQDRILITKKKFTQEDLDQLDLQTYIASSEDDEYNDEDEAEYAEKNIKKSKKVSKKSQIREKYRSLLKEITAQEEPEQEMEITFTAGLSEKANELLEKKKEKEKEKTMTVWDKYLEKRKEKKKERKKALKDKQGKTGEVEEEEVDDIPEEFKDDPFFNQNFGEEFETKPEPKKSDKKKKKLTKEEREEQEKQKAELELLMIDNEDLTKKHFNLNEIIKAEARKGKKDKKKKDKEKTEDNFEVELHDPRFNAIYESHHFAIDPTAPQFKKTKGMIKILEERQKLQNLKHTEKENGTENDRRPKSQKGFKNSELSVLVDSVKRKAANNFNFKGKRQKLE